MGKNRFTIMSLIALLVTGFFLIVGLPYGDFSWRSILAAYGNSPLSAPDPLQASAVSQTQINLSWSDPNADESHYLIERLPDGASAWTQIGTVGANTVHYMDSGLTCNTLYSYRVRAFRTDDNEVSPFSTPASVTTQACTPTEGLFALQAKLQAPTGTTSQHYGWSVDISSDGNTAIVSHLQGFDVGDGEAYIYVRSGSTWTQQAKLLPADVVSGANFGKDVAISGDGNIAVVGAWLQNGHTGAAYVYTRSGTTWTQQQKLVDPVGTYMDIYGIYVDISRDGSTIAIGAARSGGTGAVFIYTFNGSSWVQQARLVGSDSQSGDLFGHDASISDDGNTLLVASRYGDGASANTGAAYIFVRSGTTWTQQAKLAPADLLPEDWFSSSTVAISGNGNAVLIGANLQSSGTQTNAGAAYYFTRSGSTWMQQQKLTAPDPGSWIWFGTGPVLSSDGTLALITAYDQSAASETAGAVYVYTLNGGQWTKTQKLLSTAMGQYDHGNVAAIDQGGNTILVGASYEDNSEGAAYVFVRDTAPLPDPSNLTATPVSSTQIDLSWSDNSTDETEFQLERSPDGVSSWTSIGTVGANGTTYSNTGLTCNTTYHYRVRAYRSSDNRYSAYSPAGIATTLACAPLPPPNNLTATAISPTRVALTWNDHSTDETSFHLERSFDGFTGWFEVGAVGPNDTTYTDTAAACNTFYYYRVRAYRSTDNQYSTFSPAATVTTQACQAVNAPTDLVAVVVSPASIDLNWTDHSIDDTAFRVERSLDGSSNWTQIGSTAASAVTYSDTAITCGTVYYYRVRAYRGTDNQYSLYSNTAHATACSPLYAPTNLSAVVIVPTARIDLNWTDQTTDETEFRVERSPDGTSRWEEIGSTAANVTTYSDPSVICGAVYYYRVRAFRGSDGQFSPATSEAHATACSPLYGPSDLTAKVLSASQIKLDWTDNSPNETAFRIERSPDGLSNWTQIGNVSANVTTYTDTSLVCGTEAYYRVRAFRSSDGQYSLFSSAAHVIACMPDAPSDLTATAISQTRIDLSWTDNAATETNFKIERSPDGTSGWAEIQTLAANTQAYSNTALTCGTTYYYRVRAVRSTGNLLSGYSNVSSAATRPCSPVTGPVLLTPTDREVTADNTPAFTWEAVANAHHYQIQIDEVATFATPEQNIDVTGLTYTSPALPDQPLYYWRVRGVTSYGDAGPWSAVRRFTVNTKQPAVPTLTAPVNQTNSPDTTPLFRWSAVAGATQYHLWIDDDPGFNSPLTYTPTTATYTLTGPLPYGVYYWRVQAGNAADTWGDWSAAFTLNLTIHQLPANGSFSTDTTPLLRWSAVTGATGYTLQIADNANFTGATSYPLGLVTSYTLPDLAPHEYFWRLQVQPAADPAAWTPGWSFTITASIPVALVPGLPAANSRTADPTPAFSWGTVSDAVSYEFQLDEVSTFASPRLDVTQSTASFTPADNLPDGRYYWRVRAFNDVATAGLWSAARLVIIDTAAPRLLSPADQSGTTLTTATLKWSASATAALYRIWIDDDPLFGSYTEFTTTTLTQVVTLPGPGVYHWRVRFEDAAGNPGVWSAAWQFSVVNTVIKPARPVLASPATGSPTNNTQPTFGWNTAANGTSYQFQIDSVNTFASPDEDVTVSGLTHTLGVSLAPGRYYWRVRAISAEGIAGPWSAIWNIQIDLTPPPAPKLSLPADNTGTPTTAPRLVWLAVTGAGAYRLQVDTVASFDSAELNIIDPILTTNYTLSLLADGTTYYWRVQAQDRAGNWGGWSATYHFTVTMLKTPLNGSAKVDTTPTFVWNAVTGASYEFQLDTSPSFDSMPLPDQYSGGATTRTSPVLAYGTYYWRVRPVIGGVPGTWSQVWTVTVTTTPPAAPKQVTLANNALTSETAPTFAWMSAARGLYYQIQIASDTTFAYPIQNVTGGENILTYTALPLPDGKYYWRVRAYNIYDVPGAWSTVFNFTVDATPPDAPVLVAPLTDASVTNAKLKLSWTRVPDAVKYELLLDRTPSFTQPSILLGNVLTYTPLKPLSQGEYQWCVLAIDKAGNVSACSEVRTFTLVAGNTISIDSPLVLDAPYNTADLIEAETVAQTGVWTTYDTDAASGGRYVYSSGTAGDALSLTFAGTGVDIVYVQHPAMGTLAVEIDGVIQQTIISTSDRTVFGARVAVNGLAVGSHTLRVYAVAGTIALDAFQIIPADVPATPVPTGTPESTATPATPAPLPVLLVPMTDSFAGSLPWTPGGSWQPDTQSAYQGSGWFVEALTRNQSSTLTAGYQLDLRTAAAPQLTFWQQMTLTGGDVAALDVSLDGGLTWLPLDVQIGTASAWTLHTVDLTAYRGAIIQLRFRLDTLGQVPEGQSAFGWWIDELAVSDMIPPTTTPDAWILPAVVPTEVPTELPPADEGGWVLPES